MSRVLLAIAILVFQIAVSGCGASELETAEKTVQQLTRELQIKTTELKTVAEKLEDPKLENLQESMTRLKSKLEREIEALGPKVEEAKQRLEQLKSQGQ